MYGFTEVTGSAQVTPYGLKTSFGGIVLDDEIEGFKTLNVTGRAIVDRDIHAYDWAWHGAKEGRVLLAPRIISVQFILTAKSNEMFRSAFDELNSMFIGSQKTLSFTDEDALFYATLMSFSNPTEDTNDLIGELEFICNDPFKYSPEKSIQSGDTRTIGGHESTTWKTRTEFTTNQTGYTLQFNSPGETDLKDINKIVLNGSFRSGDILEIFYKSRTVKLNGKDISNQLVIMQSNYMEFPVGSVEFEASHKTELFYHERYY